MCVRNAEFCSCCVCLSFIAPTTSTLPTHISFEQQPCWNLLQALSRVLCHRQLPIVVYTCIQIILGSLYIGCREMFKLEDRLYTHANPKLLNEFRVIYINGKRTLRTKSYWVNKIKDILFLLHEYHALCVSLSLSLSLKVSSYGNWQQSTDVTET